MSRWYRCNCPRASACLLIRCCPAGSSSFMSSRSVMSHEPFSVLEGRLSVRRSSLWPRIDPAGNEGEQILAPKRLGQEAISTPCLCSTLGGDVMGRKQDHGNVL